MSLKRVMGAGVLAIECPHPGCGKLLETSVHVVSVSADPERRKSPLTGTTYGHRVEFIAEAPKLHAELWGHIVAEHQPLPHPYLQPATVRQMVDRERDEAPDDQGLSMWEQEYQRIQAQGGK